MAFSQKRVSQSSSRKTQQSITDVEISQLVEQLNADAFADRRTANRRLLEIGLPAIEQLSKAIQQGDREQSTRAMSILARFYNGPSQEARLAAQEAFTELSESSNAALAARANAVLNPSVESPRPIMKRVPAQVVAPQQGQFNFQFQFGNGAKMKGGNVRRISTKVVNGVRDVTAKENGRTVKIHEEPGKKLTVEIKQDGKTEKFEATDIDQLRKQNPKAARVYDEYSGNGVKVQFNKLKLDPRQIEDR